MYWLIYRHKNKLSGNSALYFEEFEELEIYLKENENIIEKVDIAIPEELIPE